MSRVLVLYGTTDGHTKKVAEALAAACREEGCEAAVIDARDARAVRPDDYDGVIVAASVHFGRYQRAVRRWVRVHAERLSQMPTGFVSVCLGIFESRPEAHQEALAVMRRFLRRTGWRPTTLKTVAGALPYTRYGPLKQWVMRRSMAKVKGDTDTTRDFEYTDWSDLRAFARSFARDQALAPAVVNAP